MELDGVDGICQQRHCCWNKQSTTSSSKSTSWWRKKVRRKASLSWCRYKGYGGEDSAKPTIISDKLETGDCCTSSSGSKAIYEDTDYIMEGMSENLGGSAMRRSSHQNCNQRCEDNDDDYRDRSTDKAVIVCSSDLDNNGDYKPTTTPVVAIPAGCEKVESDSKTNTGCSPSQVDNANSSCSPVRSSISSPLVCPRYLTSSLYCSPFMTPASPLSSTCSKGDRTSKNRGFLAGKTLPLWIIAVFALSVQVNHII